MSDERCQCYDCSADREIAALKAALKAAQAVLNELQCYSTGVAVMAEPEIVELMGEYTEAVDKV